MRRRERDKMKEDYVKGQNGSRTRKKRWRKISALKAEGESLIKAIRDECRVNGKVEKGRKVIEICFGWAKRRERFEDDYMCTPKKYKFT